MPKRKKREKYRVWFVPTLSAVLAYYRMEQFVKELRKDDEFEIAYSYHPHDFTDCCEWEHSLNQAETLQEFDQLASCADLMIFQSVHYQQSCAMLSALKDKYQKPIFAEYDDNPMGVSPTHPSYNAIAPGSTCELWQLDQIKMADGLIMSTPHLAKYLSPLNKNSYIVPNAIDIDLFKSENKVPKNDTIRIGWAGGANHKDDLDLIYEPMMQILKTNPNVVFVLFCGGEIPVKFRTQRVELHDFREWKDIDKYPEFLTSLNFDIGLAPLRDTEFNRSKSNLRFLEYSAMGIPTVASNVEPYKSTKALLCTEPEDWISSIQTLLSFKQKRGAIAKSSYNYVKKQYSILKVTQNYSKILKSTIDNWRYKDE